MNNTGLETNTDKLLNDPAFVAAVREIHRQLHEEDLRAEYGMVWPSLHLKRPNPRTGALMDE